MGMLFPRYVEAFRRKAPAYRAMLAHGSSVLEIGSHLGGFLQASEEWNWRAVGQDVGRHTSEFVRRMGFAVRRQMPEEFRPPPGGLDAEFVWNCFEQIPDPAHTLRAVHQALKGRGLLVIRVPNAAFYRHQRRRNGRSGIPRAALRYNNLLGFPYLYGYTLDSLNRLMRQSGFELVRAFNTELLTTPFADPALRIVREEEEVSRAIARWVAARDLTGPWLAPFLPPETFPPRRKPQLGRDRLPLVWTLVPANQ
ncbi:MAG: class I SAM-dependent methyltransferase [Bryobacteraceae bacterium]|nr:class I SAM-dependent methyltransferase [Bryobacteraceae bacterium]